MSCDWVPKAMHCGQPLPLQVPTTPIFTTRRRQVHPSCARPQVSTACSKTACLRRSMLRQTHERGFLLLVCVECSQDEGFGDVGVDQVSESKPCVARGLFMTHRLTRIPSPCARASPAQQHYGQHSVAPQSTRDCAMCSLVRVVRVCVRVFMCVCSCRPLLTTRRPLMPGEAWLDEAATKHTHDSLQGALRLPATRPFT